MEAEKDKDIVTVHAGMHMETSFELFRERFPDKFFDVGMAEQHAVTFSAGLSCGGLKPFCIIPSTFLQRAYDQVKKFSHRWFYNNYIITIERIMTMISLRLILS